MGDIHEVKFHSSGKGERMVEETLEAVKEEGATEIIVLYFDKNEEFTLRSSSMLRKDALWLLHLGIDHVVHGAEE